MSPGLQDPAPQDPAPELIVPDPSSATPEKAPTPEPARSPAPDGLIRFTVTQVSWQRQQPGTSCQVAALADTWASGSSGTLSLMVGDTSLDHLRVGDVLVLHADPREPA